MLQSKFKSDDIKELMGALAKAQGEMGTAEKDGYNKYHDASFSSMAAMHDASRAALAKYELAVTHLTAENEKGKPVLLTIMGHSSGQWIGMETPLLSKSKSEGILTSQDLAASVGFAKRVAYPLIVGLASEEVSEDEKETKNRRPSAQQPRANPPSKPGDDQQVIADWEVKNLIKTAGDSQAYMRDYIGKAYAKTDPATLTKLEYIGALNAVKSHAQAQKRAQPGQQPTGKPQDQKMPATPSVITPPAPQGAKS